MIAAALGGVIIGLLSVGVVSHTPLRHLIQVLPAVLAFALVTRNIAWARFAALPIFTFWFLIMLGIWLFLLGLARIITGHYSSAEVLLTLVIGISCLVGLAASVRASVTTSRVRAGWVILAFAALQVGALWLSLRPAFARS